MSIRLSKAIGELNIGLQTAVEFLEKNSRLGEVIPIPSFKLNDEQYAALVEEFKSNKEIKKETARIFPEHQEEKDQTTIEKTYFEHMERQLLTMENYKTWGEKRNEHNLKFTDLGYIGNKDNCIQKLSEMLGKPITWSELDEFINSDEFQKEYIDKYEITITEKEAKRFRIKLPWKNKNGNIYGYFQRNPQKEKYFGVLWGDKYYNFRKKIKNSLDSLRKICNQDIINEDVVIQSICTELKYYNGAGFTNFPDGTKVNQKWGKFIKFTTNLHNSKGVNIVGWLMKEKKYYKGIFWGTEEDFRNAQDQREMFFMGRIMFDNVEKCNEFLEKVKEKILDEPWEYKKKKNKKNKLKYPILHSYLGYELERLYHEQELYNKEKNLIYENKIIYNDKKDKAIFNTNLLDKYGHDFIIMGKIEIYQDKEHLKNPRIIPSNKKLKEEGFDCEMEDTKVPTFFKEIEEIVFNCNWSIDQDMGRYEHIIEDRRDRFPEKYKDFSVVDLAQKLDSAIAFAKKIAQRNYKFIVPMYYPAERRIQLLMPIYLENKSMEKTSPDIVLVLTPHPDKKLYELETILELEDAYQDARLIAKPEEPWLKPN